MRLTRKYIEEYTKSVSEKIGVELHLSQYAHADDGRHWYITYGSYKREINSTPFTLREVNIFLDGLSWGNQVYSAHSKPMFDSCSKQVLDVHKKGGF